jgi:hypothetical protein
MIARYEFGATVSIELGELHQIVLRANGSLRLATAMVRIVGEPFTNPD